MNDHYFSVDPQAKHEIKEIQEVLFGDEYTFLTDAGVFSRDGVDEGSKLLIAQFQFQPGQKILDVGCGYGPLGIVAARLAGESGSVDMIDVNQRAIELAKKNAALNRVSNIRVWASDGLAQVYDQYDWIVTNPPIRAGKQVIYGIVEQAKEHLVPGGGLMLVIRTKQGAKSMAKKMEEVYGNVETLDIKKGYRILKSVKHSLS
ncbi:MAG: class I SAM-dependent methyltransferase [Firmicutes bacterium]|nr:class I SAM-dependent methyltransferase [Bacillota bacterium]